MYRSNLGTKDKGGALIAVVAIHALLLLALLHLSGTLGAPDTQAVLRVFDLAEPPPPPPPPPPKQPAPKPKAPEGASAPANIKSQATPVVAPKPVPKPTPVVAAEKPAQGAAATQGAAAVAGPGTGAGGSGNGTGSGSGSGTGSGSGSGGGVVSPPRLVTPVLRGRDFPRQMLDDWPRGAPVFLRLRIDAQGNVAECIVDRGTGVGAIDSEVCSAVRQHLRFRPALNAAGQAVAGWFGYVQPPPR